MGVVLGDALPLLPSFLTSFLFLFSPFLSPPPLSSPPFFLPSFPPSAFEVTQTLFRFWQRRQWQIFSGSRPRRAEPSRADEVRDCPVETLGTTLKKKGGAGEGKGEMQTWSAERVGAAECFLSRRRACSQSSGTSWGDQSELWPVCQTWLLQNER